MSRIAVIGGHGKVALLLAPILVARGDEVTSLVRRADQVADVNATGARAVVADVEQLSASELSDVLRGHDAVVWSAGAGGGDPRRTYGVDRDAAIRSMEATRGAGITRYVMVSYLGAGLDHGVPPDSSFYAYAQAKAAADDYLRGTDLEWTIVAPGTLTLEPGTGAIDAGSPDDGDAPDGGSVPREDVARVIAEVLQRRDTIGRFIAFVSGADAIADAVTPS
ncbi:NAD-dependent dehydratase [Luteimicrobium album]|uniref:NAD-dependent dehydratase n=1 Tax=Luteimicrobium album TaxID=1054550 RepID=A0ABQ6I0F8_9MICO|nr:NAD(P)H-binding protein [Luteimicrobium album]GMA24204.1 NAD-dependent dehydratase [Luteimicrobium album]